MTGLAFALAWVGVIVSAGVTLLVLRYTAAGLTHLSHDKDRLPAVVTGRNAALFFFSLFAAPYQNLTVIAVWSATRAFLGCVDAYIYKKAGKEPKKHLVAGGVAAVIALTAFVAMI